MDHNGRADQSFRETEEQLFTTGSKPTNPNGLGLRPFIRRFRVLIAFLVIPALVGVAVLIGHKTGLWDAWSRRMLDNITDARTYWTFIAIILVSWLADGLSDVLDQEPASPPLNKWWVGQQILRATASITITTFFTIVSIDPNGWLAYTPIPLYLTAFVAVVGDTYIIIHNRVHEGLHEDRGRLLRVISLHFVVLIAMPAMTVRAAGDPDLPLGSLMSVGGLIFLLLFREYYNRFAPTTVSKHLPQVDRKGEARLAFLNSLYSDHLNNLSPAAREITIMRYGQPLETALPDTSA